MELGVQTGLQTHLPALLQTIFILQNQQFVGQRWEFTGGTIEMLFFDATL